ncbi:aminotransferase class III-fold pyridoxal phosphate-dependent enzyme [Ruegeria sp. 2012CJ41-6]|uniref:Aminotransferase class III-fold pyridoxal phosphate-dependent enzyme n=1 Tax=Ruegeria spongiae TaxID=2942209 RepID=A0ABT0Q8F6_9RHOB|nr:aminotransferase class III-fold pyridoxal phosphate-dependent enzyme [Ruegeria spongiae]MCL6285837.1 aminotransferase class III-fold pyridoxal phosphate-dependent enzyme [Ruegeria spongiae]
MTKKTTATATATSGDNYRSHILDFNHKHLIPHRLDTFRKAGVEILIGEREGYEFKDVNGKSFLDFHLNGGTYNFGHRHPEFLAALQEGLKKYDIGNHHFPSGPRAEFAEALIAAAPGDMPFVSFASSGSEAVDLAIKVARQTTGRRAIVAFDCAYHGRSGLSGAAGDASTAAYFLSDNPEVFLTVPFNDLDAMERVLSTGQVAAALIETIPATAGFMSPDPGYLQGVADLCRKHGTLYISDEVQTGLMRTGDLWGTQTFGVEPDLMVTGKGVGGGIYPFAALLMSDRCSTYLKEYGWGHVTTFGGSELGCIVSRKVIEVAQRPEVAENVAKLSAYFKTTFAELQARHPHLEKVHQNGVVIGLKTSYAEGGIILMKELVERGVWAIFAGFDMSTLQFKPGVLLDMETAKKGMERLDDALAAMADLPIPKAEPRPKAPIASSIPQIDVSDEVVQDLERAVDAHLQAPDFHPLKTIGQGEICVTVAFPKENPVAAFKRLPPFPNRARAEAYLGVVNDYISSMEKAGCPVVPTEGRFVATSQDGVGLYLCQPLMSKDQLVSNILRAATPDVDHPVLNAVLETTKNATSSTLGIDAQVSNWVWLDGKAMQIDVSTPFMRTSAGKEILDLDTIMKPYPALLRPYLRRFMAPELLKSYYDLRENYIDLLGNLNREGMPQWIDPTLVAANRWLPSNAQITREEVDKAYKTDAGSYELAYRLKLVNAWWMRNVRRTAYPFILQKPEKR